LIEGHAVGLQDVAQILFRVSAAIIYIAIDVQLAVLDDYGFVPQLNPHGVAEFHWPGFGLVLSNSAICSSGFAFRPAPQAVGKVLYLRTGQSNATVRRKGAKLSRSFATVYQRRQADRIDWSQRIQLIAGLDFWPTLTLLPGDSTHGSSGGVKLVEDDRVSFTQSVGSGNSG
jgi:hypothetical protein